MLEDLDWRPRRRYCDAWRKCHSGYCRNWPVPGKTRCRLHGGLSSGPRTSEGKARAVSAMVEGRRRWVERMKAEGKKFPGGRKAGTRWVTPAMRARAKEEQAPRGRRDFPGEERAQAASRALALLGRRARRAAIRAMPVQEARLAALRALDVLWERFQRTGSLRP